MKYLHSMIRVKDIEKSLKFYIDFMGLKISKISELEDCKLYFLEDENGFRALELAVNFETREKYELGNCFGHLAFGVKNLDKLSEKMKEFGYCWLHEPFILNRPKESNKKTKIAFVKDPDGIEIEFIEKNDA